MPEKAESFPYINLILFILQFDGGYMVTDSSYMNMLWHINLSISTIYVLALLVNAPDQILNLFLHF